MATKKTKASSNKIVIKSWKERISEIPRQVDPQTGEIIRHKWLYACEESNVFLRFFLEDPNFQFSSLRDERDGMESFWDTDLHYGKWRMGPKIGLLKDDKGRVREDIPYRKRYMVGRGDKKRLLIENLQETFRLLKRDDIVKNLEKQLPGKSVSANEPKKVVSEDHRAEVKVANRSGCANIPMRGLLIALSGGKAESFEDMGDVFVSVSLAKDPSGKPYYRVDMDAGF